MRPRYRLQCQACGRAFWTLKETTRTCTRSCAIRLGHQTRREQATDAQRGTATTRTGGGEGTEQADHVERLYAAAVRSRLYAEWQAGQRRYTVTDGWTQRAGRSAMDGEIRMAEAGGEAW